ncbi:MAG TPA: lytic transglycosylase domain-containing protein [Vicinamibacterales bacterium]|nr:lytic transglycosylase domain-containing protein [Vicinamibacterales bacterium]
MLSSFRSPNGLRYILTATIVLAAAPARAQIYTWRDANGHLVLSDHKPGEARKTFAVRESQSIRATRYVAGERSRTYDDLIVEHARENNVRVDLVRAVMQVESGFNPLARSPKGAMGLMQLMPATAKQYGVRNAYNPAENVRAGVAYLRALLDRYDNNEELALAAYNAGPGAVDNHGQTVPPYRETKDYVASVNRLAGGRPIELRGSGATLYKVTKYVDGRAIPLYTNTKPTSGSYEVVTK